MLEENKRIQLDGIVNQMIESGESDSNIQFVVNDFKSKYSTPDVPEKQPKANGLVNELAQNVNSAWDERRKELYDIKAQGDSGTIPKSLEALKGGANVGKAIGDVGVEAGKMALKIIPQGIKDRFNANVAETAPKFMALGKTVPGKFIANTVGKAVAGDIEIAKDLAKKYPTASQYVEPLVSLGISGASIATAPAVVNSATSLFSKGIQATKNTAGSLTNSVKSSAPAIFNSSKKTGKNAILEIISPKITSKETQAIINEGRLTRGKESVLFGKQPDIVQQSDAMERVANTIERTIPKADKMNDVQLSSALDTKIGEVARSLKTEMKVTPVKQTTTGKVRDAWSRVKNEQALRPEFLDNEAGNKAFQNKFENYLKQLEWDITDEAGKFKTPTPKTLDDIWEVRKSYDDSIPENVKRANSNSSPVLQDRKQMWLENRSILNAAINDQIEGLGSTSKKAFAEMSDMYDARQNIASKAKIDPTGRMGLLPKNRQELLKAGIGAGVTYIIGRDILGF